MNLIRHLPSVEISEGEIRQMPSDELGTDLAASFLSLGFSHHVKILMSCKDREEIWYYIARCAKEMWSYEHLLAHLRADDYHHIGALPNNFAKTLSPMAQ